MRPLLLLLCFIKLADLSAKTNFPSDEIKYNLLDTNGKKNGLWVEDSDNTYNIGEYKSGKKIRYWFSANINGELSNCYYYYERDSVFTVGENPEYSLVFADNICSTIDCLSRIRLDPQKNDKNVGMEFRVNCNCPCDSFSCDTQKKIKETNVPNEWIAYIISTDSLYKVLQQLEYERVGIYCFLYSSQNRICFRYYDQKSKTSISWYFDANPLDLKKEFILSIQTATSHTLAGYRVNAYWVFNEKGEKWIGYRYNVIENCGEYILYRKKRGDRIISCNKELYNNSMIKNKFVNYHNKITPNFSFIGRDYLFSRW